MYKYSEFTKGCPNGHSVISIDKFCSNCGAEINLVERIEEEALDFDEMIKKEIIPFEIDGTFVLKSVENYVKDALVPNNTKFGVYLEEEEDYPLYANKPDMKAFYEYYCDELDILKEAYESIEVLYGVVTNWE